MRIYIICSRKENLCSLKGRGNHIKIHFERYKSIDLVSFFRCDLFNGQPTSPLRFLPHLQYGQISEKNGKKTNSNIISMDSISLLMIQLPAFSEWSPGS